jgi:hypothetical protein
MRKRELLAIFALLVGTAAFLAVMTSRTSRPTRQAAKKAGATGMMPGFASTWGHLPLSFEQNKGQTDGQVKFLSHGSGYGIFLTRDAAVLSLVAPKPERKTSARLGPVDARAAREFDTTAVSVRLAGANQAAEVRGIGQLPGRANYFIGNDPSKWNSSVPVFAKVQYTEVYPGVDVVFHGNQRQLEYDFDVAAGADTSRIALNIEGARQVSVNARGEAVMKTHLGDVVLQKPVSYQEIAGRRKMVASSYELRGERKLGIRLAAYDPSKALVIDPTLTYSTYLGGSAEDDLFAAAADSSGNAYVAGQTFSTNFPVVNAYESTNPTGGVVTVGFVSEVNAAGSALVFSTYFGGSGSSLGGDSADGVAVDASGNVYVTGGTVSSNFPVTLNAYQTQLGGLGSAAQNAFLSVFSPGGLSLTYSTYLGGSISDLGVGVAVDNGGNAYVGGVAISPDFPVTTNAFQLNLNSASSNGFLSKISTTSTGAASLAYSTFIGGSSSSTNSVNLLNVALSDAAFGVAIDGSGDAFVTGQTTSIDFPVSSSGAFQSTYAGGNADGFVIELNTVTGGAGLSIYSTYLGGSQTDAGSQVAIDSAGDAYVVGTTNSSNFPTLNAPQSTLGGLTDAFITELKTGGASLAYSTFAGGSSGDYGLGIAVDSSGQAYVAGSTFSSNYPVTSGAFQTTNNALGLGQTNAFVTIAPANGGSSFVYSTYFGGSGASDAAFKGDSAYGIAVDTSSNIYLGGITASSNFPTMNPLQGSLAGLDDGFVAKFANTSVGLVTLTPSTLNFGTVTQGSSSSPMTVTLTNDSGSTLTVTAIPFRGANATDFIETDTCLGIPVAEGGTCTINVVFTPSTTSPEVATLGVTSTPATTATVALSGVGTEGTTTVTFAPMSLTFPATPINSASSPMNVTLTNIGTAALSVSGVTFTGTNASDYTQSNACTNIAPNGACTVAVVFTPHQSGASTASMDIADNATGSPQVVTISGTGTDFSAPVLSPSSLTVSPGGGGTFTATVSPVDGFTGSVSFACTGAPTLGTCAGGTPVVNPDGSTTDTFTITTMAQSFAPPIAPRGAPSGRLPGAPFAAPLAILAVLLLGTMVTALAIKSKEVPALAGNRLRALSLIAALALFGGLAACGTSSSISNTGTPPGTYLLTVTATSGTLSHSSTFTLTVQ